MFRQFVGLCVFFTCIAGTAADEVVVTWQRLGSEFYAKNKLPAGATVKIKVTYVPDNTMGQKFTVNGQKFTAKAKGDVFEVKVGNQGKLRITHGNSTAENASNAEYGMVWTTGSGLERKVSLGLAVRVIE